MKGGHGPRAARRRDSCTVRNRRTRMSAARFWEGLIPALNYHYTDTSKAFFAALFNCDFSECLWKCGKRYIAGGDQHGRVTHD